MNASNALFRSHLMQQFAAAARTQSRPPLALASENTRRQNVSSTRRTSSTTGGEQQQMDSSTSTLAFPNQTHSVTPTPSTKKTAFHSFASTSAASVKQDSHHTCTSRSEQESRVLHEDLEYKYEELNDNTKQHTHVQRQDNDASQSLMVNPLQSLIQSRCTAVNFGPMEPEKLRNALDRAIACALAAPNHHRTEPFFFKRLLAPSFSSHRLADVAARVVFAKKSKSDPLSAQAHADRKRNKWNQIPAFLVTLVANNQTPVVGDGVNIDEYTPLDFSPPETERQLEDYAAACAAVQNILLSLHAEGIGTKWATGAVVKTPAFRSLLNFENTDRVVGLIMVGGSSASNKVSAKRHRKRREDLVQDV